MQMQPDRTARRLLASIVPPLLGACAMILGATAPALAAGAGPALDGARLGLVWAIPFAAMLLSIAILPLAAPAFWHAQYGKVSAACALGFLVPAAMNHGLDTAAYELVHTLLLEYVPFIVLLLALYVVAGGIRLTGTLVGTPEVNTAILAFGTLIASWTGTTGACVLLIQPLIRANAWRTRRTHVFVFFIFLVGNVGGGLTPLGDPPLFIGFLEGVDFFWTLRAMALPTLAMAVPLLAAFFVIDRHLHRREPAPAPAGSHEPFGIDGKRNLVLLVAVIGVVLASGAWRSGISFTIHHTVVTLESAARTVALLAIVAASLLLTRRETRTLNDFDWHPIVEVAKLFIGIFVTIVPVLAIVRAGAEGAAAGLVDVLAADGRPHDPMYFWITGILSAFLDNAPTYLLFFNFAGGDAQVLMGPRASTLLAISAGAVFFGAVSYIGNAPNFMVKAICERRGIAMPSFFGYLAWSTVFLLPLFVVVNRMFFA
ncbi:MAG: sodium:proton antiporter [Alphaproteobacteria bacterium]|nr:sodium:proton antiporter [Alphaproteobacteria bacterium]